jgi:hypothetical protein
MAISDQLRDAIRNSGLTHYRIGTDTGTNIRTIDRFVGEEKPIYSTALDVIGDYLGLELCRKKGQTAKKQPAKKRTTTAKRKHKN